MNRHLSIEQVDQLLRPINPVRVSKDGKGFSHVEAYDIRAHMNRIFGFLDWSIETVACDLVFETESLKNGKTVWTVCYRATAKLTVLGVPYSDVATGDASNQPSRSDAHDLACKTAASQALKRAAVNLGDQFGLSLYNKGSVRPLVKAVIGHHEMDPTAGVDSHITTPLAPENDTTETPQREVSTAEVALPKGRDASLPSGEAPPAADNDEFSLICGSLDSIARMAPDDALSTVTELMTTTAKHKFGNRKVPGDPAGRTLSAKLQAALKWASEQQKEQEVA